MQLHNLRADDLRVRLERLLGRPLAASTDNSGQWQTFEIEATPGAGVKVTVNPTTGQLHLSGPPNRTAAWQQVIAALDRGPFGEGTVTQLVATKAQNHDRIRKVLEAVQSQYGPQATPGRLTAMLQQQTENGATPPSGTTAPPATAAGGSQNGGIDLQTAQDAANLGKPRANCSDRCKSNLWKGST